jgi:K+-transporting ATPase ATPase A chain
MSRPLDWLQLAVFVVLLALMTKPMGLYLCRVLDAKGKTWLDPIMKPLERLTYWLMGVDPEKEQDWKLYTYAMLLFSLVSCLLTYAILRLQKLLPLNPQGFDSLSPDLSFSTAVSFTTNTNWQSYAGESTMSYLSQMLALVIHNFGSAAVGISLAAALVRGVARQSARTLGHFWVDLVRVTYYLLLPVCVVFAVCLISQGMIQNFKPYTKAKLTESYTIQVAKTDDKGQPVTTNVAVMVQTPKLDAKGQPVMTNGVAMLVDVPKLDEKGQPVMTNMPVMVDQKV